MNKFIEFACKFIPNYQQSICGASQEEIVHFKQLVGYPLPKTYEEYLLYLGHENGGVEIICDGTMNIMDLIEFYEQDIVPGHSKVPPDCIIVGIGGTIVEEISLQGISSKKPQVVFSGGGKVRSLYAESFEKLLFRSLFTQEQHQLFSNFSRLTSTDNKRLVELSHDVAVNFLDFKPLWFSDSIAFCGEREDATISVLQGEKNDATTIKIATQQESEMNHIIAVFMDNLGVDLRRW